jgi:cytochrome c oxidase cbb3-type subunit 3
MPGWAGRLDPVTIKMLAAYVHSRGGGEATPKPTADTDAKATSAQGSAGER